MMTKQDWNNVVDDAMYSVGVTTAGGYLHKAILEHQGKKFNSKINIGLRCAGCATAMYFAIEKVAAQHWSKGSSPPPASCPQCRSQGPHAYTGLKS